MLNKTINGLPIAIAFGLVGYWTWSQLPKQSQAANFKLASIDQKQEYDPPADKWDVVNVHDGDTIRIRRGTEEKKIRFSCVDAPELSQPMGVKSRDYLRSLIAKSGNKVSVKIVDVDTPNGTQSDRYRRSVAEVWAGDELVQSVMAGVGMVYSFDRYKQNCISWNAVTSSEEYAKSRFYGVWADKNAVKPWDYRRR